MQSFIDTPINLLHTISRAFHAIEPIIQQTWPDVRTVRDLRSRVTRYQDYYPLFPDDVRLFWMSLFRPERMLSYAYDTQPGPSA